MESANKALPIRMLLTRSVAAGRVIAFSSPLFHPLSADDCTPNDAIGAEDAFFGL